MEGTAHKEGTFRPIKYPSTSVHLHHHVPGPSGTCYVTLLTVQRNSHQSERAREERGKREGGGKREARTGCILTLTANVFDAIVTYLFIKECALALYFGLCRLGDKYKMENVQLDKTTFLSSTLGQDLTGSNNIGVAAERRPMPGK